jgi:hypothetical protein
LPGKPSCQIIWREGDDAIKYKLSSLSVEESAKHQMMCLLRVLLQSKEKMRKSAVRVDDMVLCRRGSAFDSADCAPPPPPSSPFSLPAGNQRRSNWGGGAIGGGAGRFPPLAIGYGDKVHMSNSYNSSINGLFDAD